MEILYLGETIMRKKILHLPLVFLVLTASALSTCAQTDVAASLYGAFTGTTTGNGVEQSPSNQAGFLIELRHIRNPVIGYEATYSYNRANQSYSELNGFSTEVPANAHEVTGDWIASLRIANLRPFALAGVGALFNQPANSGPDVQSETKAVFVYGAGLDWRLVPHIGLRFQYRGNLYKAPDLTRLYTSTDAFTHTAEPMIGAYFRL
jgi:opacity protein-like surface antigen